MTQNTNCGPPPEREHLHDRILEAAKTPATVQDIAAYAGITDTTLRRWYTCLNDYKNPAPDPDACAKCSNYARNRGEGVVQTLQECRPEFLASLHGYSEKQEIEHSGSIEHELEGLREALREGVEASQDTDADGDEGGD